MQADRVLNKGIALFTELLLESVKSVGVFINTGKPVLEPLNDWFDNDCQI